MSHHQHVGVFRGQAREPPTQAVLKHARGIWKMLESPTVLLSSKPITINNSGGAKVGSFIDIKAAACSSNARCVPTLGRARS